MSDRILYTPRKPFVAGSARKRRWFFVIGVAVAGTLFAGVAFLPFGRVTHVELNLPAFLNESAIRAQILAALEGRYGHLIPRSFLLAAPVREIGTALKAAFPRVEDVSFERKFPDTLVVTVIERTFFSVLCGEKGEDESPPQCVSVDQKGVAYETAPHVEGALIARIESDFSGIRMGSRVIDEKTIAAMRSLSDGLEEIAGIKTVGYRISSRVPSEIRLRAAAGFTVIFKRDDDAKIAAAILKNVLDGEIREKQNRLDYVDLRFGRKVFYKYRF